MKVSMFKEGYPINMTPYFDGSYYEFWRIRICVFMKSIDFSLWNIVKKIFVSQPKFIWNEDDKNCFALNIKV